jgi:CHASE2 domain-containing sensor protein
MPAIIIYRNYFHAHLMMMRRTGGMAYGSILRVGGIYACAHVCFSLGWLSPVNATLILILGFVIEAVIAQFTFRQANAHK